VSAESSTARPGGPDVPPNPACARRGRSCCHPGCSEIFIGFIYTGNGDSANSAVGAAISRGDERQNFRAVIDAINEKGGVAGRKLVPVFHAQDAQSSEPNASQDQAACSTFTEDTKVFAVGSIGITDTFSACLAKAGVLQITSGPLIFYDDAYMRRFSTFFNFRLTQERMMRALVPALQRQGYFSGWDANLGRAAQGQAKVGIVTLDPPEFVRPVEKTLLPTLAKAGQPVDSKLIFRIAYAATTKQAGGTAADVQSAVLRLRDAGATHVIVQDATAFMTLTFLNAARNQRYFPRLGVNSGSGIQALFDSGAVDGAQFNGAVGLGWLPNIDLPAGQGTKLLTSATKECLDNNKKRTGQRFTSTNATQIALNACDSVNGIVEAIRNAGPTINVTTGKAGAGKIGGSLRTAGIPKAFFGPQRHDALETGFDLFWDSGCSCAKYRDRGRQIPS
jgi:ABC-type branched-subunit amino acid transport system substrate-binding protein